MQPNTGTGGYMWLVLLIMVAVYEGWSCFGARQSLSEWIWWYSPQHAWFRPLILTLDLLLMWHLFFTSRGK